MKRGHFIALGAALAALLLARMLLDLRGTDVATHATQAGLQRVVPVEVDPANVTWLSIEAPHPAPKEGEAAPATPARFEKRDGAWVVASRGGLPADSEAIDAFVKTALTMTGDVRGETESTWPAFGLGADAAVSVAVGAGGDEPAATILVGKQGDDPSSHFARAEGSPRAFHVRNGLRGPLGLFGEGASLREDLWLKLDVLGVKGADVARLVVERPDMRLVLERAAPAPGEDGAAAPGAFSVVEPTLPWPLQASGLDGVVERAGSVRVSGALDAAAPACAEAPAATVTFTKSGGGDVVARVRGEIAEAQQRALTIDGMPFCWGLGTWSVPSLLPKASAVWQAPQPFAAAPEGEASSVRIVRPGATLAAVKDASGWRLTSGTGDAMRVSSAAAALRHLRIEDLAEAPKVPAALQKVTATVSARFGETTLSAQLLGERPGGGGERYVRVEGDAVPPGFLMVVSKSTADSLAPQ